MNIQNILAKKPLILGISMALFTLPSLSYAASCENPETVVYFAGDASHPINPPTAANSDYPPAVLTNLTGFVIAKQLIEMYYTVLLIWKLQARSLLRHDLNLK